MNFSKASYGVLRADARDDIRHLGRFSPELTKDAQRYHINDPFFDNRAYEKGEALVGFVLIGSGLSQRYSSGLFRN